MKDSNNKKSDNKISINEFYNRVSKKGKISEEKVKIFNDLFFNYIANKLRTNSKVNIYKYGTFKKVWVKKRQGFNPASNKKIIIPGHYKVVFSPAGDLQSKVNKKYRNLRPNVLTQMLTLTGITKLDPKLKAEFEKDSDLKKKFQKAKKRAIISLIVLFIMIVSFLSAVVFVPVYFANKYQKKSVTDLQSKNPMLKFITKVNRMFGLNSISDRFLNTNKIDEQKATEFINESKDELTKQKKIIATYTVKKGDSIFSISKQFWENEYLWPYLYITNQTQYSDPDLIHPNDKIVIYEKIGEPKSFTKEEREEVVQAYIGIYRIYRYLGEQDIKKGHKSKGLKRINDSQWTLYTALRYDHKLLSKYKDAIYPEDIILLKKYIKKFSYDGKK